MTNIEVFRQAASELIDASSDEMSAYIKSKFGIVIPPRYIPVYRATMQLRKTAGKAETTAPA
jgi:hypothetical protein